MNENGYDSYGLDGDQKFWLSCWALIAIVVCVVTVCISVATYSINREAFKNGYEAASIPGVNGSHWVKAK